MPHMTFFIDFLHTQIYDNKVDYTLMGEGAPGY